MGSISNLNFYFAIIGITILVITGLNLVGQSFVEDDNNILTDDSVDKINKIGSLTSSYGYENISTKSLSEHSNESYIGAGDDEGEQLGDDVFGLFSRALKWFNSILNAISLIWNMPYLFVELFNLPLLAPIKNIINVIGWILGIGLGIMAAKATNLGGRTKE